MVHGFTTQDRSTLQRKKGILVYFFLKIGASVTISSHVCILILLSACSRIPSTKYEVYVICVCVLAGGNK